MTRITKILAAIAFTIFFQDSNAQNAEMADAFRAEGKIYVVVALVLIVLIGLITYLFLLDRKMKKLEEMIRGKRQTKSEGKSF